MEPKDLSTQIQEAGALSLDAIRQTLRAVLAQYNAGRPWEETGYLDDVLGNDTAGDAIVSINAQLWRVPYSIESTAKARTASLKMSKAERVFPQMTYVSAAGLVACLDAVATCRRHIAENVQFAIATDALVGRLRLAYQAR